jgi:hypothetical protein
MVPRMKRKYVRSGKYAKKNVGTTFAPIQLQNPLQQSHSSPLQEIQNVLHTLHTPSTPQSSLDFGIYTALSNFVPFSSTMSELEVLQSYFHSSVAKALLFAKSMEHYILSILTPIPLLQMLCAVILGLPTP